MEKKQVEDFIKKQLFNITGEEDFDFEKTIHSQSVDSLDTIELIMECEKEFNINIKDDLIDHSTTPNGLVLIIMKELEFKTT